MVIRHGCIPATGTTTSLNQCDSLLAAPCWPSSGSSDAAKQKGAKMAAGQCRRTHAVPMATTATETARRNRPSPIMIPGGAQHEARSGRRQWLQRQHRRQWADATEMAGIRLPAGLQGATMLTPQVASVHPFRKLLSLYALTRCVAGTLPFACVGATRPQFDEGSGQRRMRGGHIQTPISMHTDEGPS